MQIIRLVAYLGGALAFVNGAQAQSSVAEFYKGKQITILVGSSTGGGYDLYARHLARYMGKHVPGNPSVIVQNMPGAGGLAAANHLYSRAPRDGLTIGIVQGTLTFAQLAKTPQAMFDMKQFGWLGSANMTSNVCVFSPRAKIEGAPDLLSKEVILGASGGSTDFVPNLLNALVGTKFKLVKGYKATSEILPAVERGEVDGLCGWGWDGAQVNGRDYLDRGVISVGLESGTERHPELAARGVPFMMDLVKDEQNKKVLRFLFSYLVYVRPFITPPELPDDRLKALQTAFAETLKDSEFKAEADKAGVEIRYISPNQAEAALADALDAPDNVKQRGLEELKNAGWRF